MDFFDKLGETIVSAGKDVAQKTKDLSGTAKLNIDIKSKEDFIQKQYAEIGKMYYAEHKDDNAGAYIEQMALVTEAQDSIQKMKEEIMKLKGAAQCPNCGAQVNPGASFCGKCGAKMGMFED